MAPFCCLNIVTSKLQPRLKGRVSDQIQAINMFPFNIKILTCVASVLQDARLNSSTLLSEVMC